MPVTPLNISIVFGVDERKAKPEYTTITLPFEKPLNGWGGRKAGVKIRGKRYTVEVTVVQDAQQELELEA